MNSDDSATFIESEDPPVFSYLEEPDLNELYKHIPPPIPLIPKNKYKETLRKYELKCNVNRDSLVLNIEEAKKTSSISNNSFINSSPDPNVNLAAFCEGTNIVYSKEPLLRGVPSLSKKVKLDNLSTLPRFSTKKLAENKTDCLIFESRFESGNLGLAIKKSNDEYDLMMQNDINTKGHTQWFYFKVLNQTKSSIKFNILKFTKKDSLFNYGIKVLIHSEKKLKDTNTGWHHDGKDIKYYINNITRSSKGDKFYTLTFTYEFLYDNDCVSFAYSYPYTYTDMLKDMDFWENTYPDIVNRKTLCLTIAEKRCDMLTITGSGGVEEVKKRKGVALTARVHPGETVASWMIKGMIEFLVSNAVEAKVLREKYVFKVIPMMNPDGVFYGNYRCGLAGCDLNRIWKTPSKVLHPTVYAGKKFIKSFCKERNVEFICDFHGHSKKKNIFMYGCNLPEEPETTRAFPFILAKMSPYFYYKSCSFRMQKSKEATMRITLFKETKIPLVYTLESSFCGGDYVNDI